MFILENTKQLTSAITKAREVKPTVRMIAFGLYVVKGSNGNSYEVAMERFLNEKRISCDCKAGMLGRVCYHSVAALELHSTIAKHSQAA